MQLSKLLTALLILTAVSLDASAQPKDAADARPRVLLIGDSISIGYTPHTKRLLEPAIDVHRNPGNAGHTGMGLDGLPQWLDPRRGRWDVIHFNWGLWDLCYRDSKSKNQGKRDKVRGKLTHTVEEYRANLERIVTKLQATGAELIFATTTPVPAGEVGRKVGDDLRYNAAALDVMARRGVAIDDLHGAVRDRMDKLAVRPGNVHFTEEGSRVLAEHVAHSVKRALRQRFAAAGTRFEWNHFPPDREVVYKKVGETPLTLYVFEPTGHTETDRRPAIVFFFGGGWTSGTPSQFYPFCEYLASRGLVAIAADYRVASRHKATPFDCVEDAKSAMRWVRKHAERLGIDPKRIAAGGGSAGGHLAAATATLRGFDAAGDDLRVSPTPDALVLFNPVYDNGPSGYGHGRVRQRWREFSPLHNLRSGMPPAVVFFGTQDAHVPVSTAETFQKTMRDLGCRSELYLYEGRAHGFFNHGRGTGEDYKDTLRHADAFLASIGFLGGAPTLQIGRKPAPK